MAEFFHRLLMARVLMIVAALAILFAPHAASPALAQQAVNVGIDAGDTVDGPFRLWGKVNVSRRAPPPPELQTRVQDEFGQPEVTRAWLILHQMWDYNTGDYRYNYTINNDYYPGDPKRDYLKVGGTEMDYYDYLQPVSDSSDALMLNIRGYEPDVIDGTLSMTQWKEVFKNGVKHYKERYDNLEYIEVLNEPGGARQSPMPNPSQQYYQFYKSAYEAINEINAELNPARPLKVGGASDHDPHSIDENLLRHFANDTSPDKKLDFVSFHAYGYHNEPAAVADWEAEIDNDLQSRGLSTDVPIYVTEIGYVFDTKDNNLRQAAGMTAYQYYARNAENLELLPWVQSHDGQPHYSQFIDVDDTDGADVRMTQYGAAVKMLNMHRDEEILATSDGLDADGLGLGAMASADDQGMTVHLWNLQPLNNASDVDVDVSINNVPEAFRDGPLRVRQYLIDSQHSDFLAAGSSLELVDEFQVDGAATLSLTEQMEPWALSLWTIEPGTVDPAPDPDPTPDPQDPLGIQSIVTSPSLGGLGDPVTGDADVTAINLGFGDLDVTELATTSNINSTNTSAHYWASGGAEPSGPNDAVLGGRVTDGVLNAGGNGAPIDFEFGRNVLSNEYIFITELEGPQGQPTDQPQIVIKPLNGGSTIGDYLITIDSDDWGPTLLDISAARRASNGSLGNTLSSSIFGVAFKVSDLIGTFGDLSQVDGIRIEYLVNPGTTGYLDPSAVGLALVPEPASVALMGLGGLMLLARRRGG